MNLQSEKRIRVWSLLLSLCGLVIVVAGWAVAEREASASPQDEVLATVGEIEVSTAEVEEAVAAQLRDLERQRYTLMEQGLERAISEKLLEAEAAAQGMEKEALIAAEVESKVPAVTDIEVDAFYEARKGQINQPKEAIAGQIRDYLLSQRRQERYNQFISSLEEKYEVRKYLEPMRVEVAAEGPSVGPDDAAVTIVEFSDFECPFCSRVNPTLARVKEEYAGKVRLVFRQFPLSIHANAWKAAEASLCAHDQGRFWDLHDAMFADQKGLSVAGLKAKAEQLELDTEQFNECLDSGTRSDAVRADFEAGQAAGVSGTPAMFINGRFLNGAVPFETLADLIDEELERAEGSS